jgi:hypothetical protein
MYWDIDWTLLASRLLGVQVVNILKIKNEQHDLIF